MGKAKPELQKTAQSELDFVTEELYGTFGYYRAPAHTLDVCPGCCVEPATEKALRTRPLRTLSESDFREYNESAKSEVQPANEMLYFLPRMLELVSQDKEIHHSTEIFLQRLGRCPKGALSRDETASLLRWATSFFNRLLATNPVDPAEVLSHLDAFEVLLMLEIGGIDIEPILESWTTSESPYAASHYAIAVYLGQAGLGRLKWPSLMIDMGSNDF